MKFIKLILLFITVINVEVWAVSGGEPVNLEMRDSLVSVVMPNGTCSGVLVAKDVVLSAAHCIDLLGVPYKVVLLSKDSSTKHCNTAEVIDYNYTTKAQLIFPKKVHAPDLFILKLKSELCTGKVAKLMTQPLQPGKKVSLAGFGGGSGLWYESQQLDLRVIEPKWAEQLNTSKDQVFIDLLKLSYDYYQFAIPIKDNSTACTGDSGGPVFTNIQGQMNLYAINGAVFPNKHIGADKCNQGFLHLVTPIAPYYDWIQSQIELWR